jgi:hypothetical protein
MTQWGNALSELIEMGWQYDEPILRSPTGHEIEAPTAAEILQLRTGMPIKSVLDERSKR